MAPALTAGTFDLVVAQYRLELIGYARRLVGPDDAEDLVQAALERTWRALQRGQAIDHAPAWLYLVTRRLALNVWQARQRRPTTGLWRELAARDDVELEVENRDEARRMLQAIALLPPRQREELELELAGGASGSLSGGDRMGRYRGRQAVRDSVRPSPTMGGA